MQAKGTESARPGSGAATQRRLIDKGWTFEFFQAVRLLQHLTRQAEPVGQRGPVAKEAIHFRPHVSVGFPPTDVRRVTAREQGDATSYGVDVTFMGIYGVATPLPLHYAVDILRASSPKDVLDERDEASFEDARAVALGDDTCPQRDFLDILHHRLISLFYRAWAKYNYDATFGDDRHDVITRYLLRLIGLSPTIDRAQTVVDPVRMIRYAGVLTQHPRSASTLEGVLRDYWGGLDAEVMQFTGRWVAVAPQDQNRLGVVNATLGEDLTVGADVYDLSGALTVSLGPVDWETYVRFLPDGPAYAETRALVRLYRADPLAFRVQMRLKAHEVPQLTLSSDDTAGRLGYTTWARTGEVDKTTVTFGAGAAQE